MAVAVEALHSLLVPLDLSALSDRVVRRALSLPVAVGGTITFLHVVPNNLPAVARRQAERRARAALADEVAHLPRGLRSKLSIKSAVTVGAPATAIAQHAARSQADLIVMGRGAARPVRDSFLGSTAERVLRQARLPVLAVRSAPRGPYQRPALALDRDATAEPLLTMLFRVLEPPRPSTTIIHAHDTPYLTLSRGGLSEEALEEEERRYRQAVVPWIANLVSRVSRAATRLPDAARNFHSLVRYGDARSVIKSVVRKLDADLLLLGTHGRSGLAHVFLGTVAGDVLRAVPCDVLVVPPRRHGRRHG